MARQMSELGFGAEIMFAERAIGGLPCPSMSRRPDRHLRRAGAHTVLTAMAFGKQGIHARICPAFHRHS